MTLAAARSRTRSAVGLAGLDRCALRRREGQPVRGRPALHTALRQQGDAPLVGRRPRRHSRRSARRRRACERSTTQRPRPAGVARPASRYARVVNLGIGGSDLGPLPRLRGAALPPARAQLGPTCRGRCRVRLERRSRRTCRAHSPRSIRRRRCSSSRRRRSRRRRRSPMRRSAKAWLASAIDGVDTSAHFVAVTANVEAAHAFGVAATTCSRCGTGSAAATRCGRPVGLPIALQLGYDRIRRAARRRRERWTRISARRRSRATCLSCSASSAGGMRARSGTPQRVVVPYAQALRTPPRIAAAARRSKATASA